MLPLGEKFLRRLEQYCSPLVLVRFFNRSLCFPRVETLLLRGVSNTPILEIFKNERHKWRVKTELLGKRVTNELKIGTTREIKKKEKKESVIFQKRSTKNPFEGTAVRKNN